LPRSMAHRCPHCGKATSSKAANCAHCGRVTRTAQGRPEHEPIACPRQCRGAVDCVTLATVELDLCRSCRGLWFDRAESSAGMPSCTWSWTRSDSSSDGARPSRVLQRLPHVLLLQIRGVREHKLDGGAVRNLANDRGDRNAHSPSACPSTHDRRVEGDAIELAHGQSIARLRRAAA
jgi:hypothetical protein